MPIFVAKNIKRIPDRQPEEINLLCIMNKVIQLEKKYNNCLDTLTSHNTDLTQIKEKMEEQPTSSPVNKKFSIND